MILEECRALLDNLDDFEAAGDVRTQLEDLEARKEELRKLNESLLHVINRAWSLLRRNLVGKEQLPDLAPKIETVRQVRKIFIKNPRRMTEGKTYNNMIEQLDEAVEKLRSITLNAWEDFCKAELKTTPLEMLSTYEDEPQFKSAVEKIKTLSKSLARVHRDVPSNEEAIVEIENQLSELRNAWASLPNQDQEVKNFIEAANSLNGAELNKLTPKVQAWLRQNQMYESFRIMRPIGIPRAYR
jgi:DNA repair exonuclease SbcCD ATPase subunit